MISNYHTHVVTSNEGSILSVIRQNMSFTFLRTE